MISSQFYQSMDDAKQKPSSPPSEIHESLSKEPRPPPRTVCVICRCESEESGAHNIYVVDINSSFDFSNALGRDPTLRLDDGCFGDGRKHEAQGFCVLGSTLYIIEGSPRISPKPEGGKSVFTFELKRSPLMFQCLRLEKSMLDEAPPMHYPKPYPSVIATPDGKKLLVFPSVIWVVPPGKKTTAAADRCDFELYDPANQSWRKLPGICDNWGDEDDWMEYFFEAFGFEFMTRLRSNSFTILMYTFISQSVFFLQTEIGMFILDLDDDSGGWKRLDSFYGDRRIPKYLAHTAYFLLIGDGLCLTPFCAYDLGLSKLFYFPNRSSPPASPHEFHTYANHAVTLLDVDNEVCNFCIIQTDIKAGDGNHPDLIIDMYRCDLIIYREEDKERFEHKDGPGERAVSLPPGTTLVRSLRFPLNAEGYQRSYPLFVFFSVGE